jgi:uncharacterized protein
MDTKELIHQTEDHVTSLLTGEGTGHDWFHIDRVRKLALFIANKEGADPTIVELAALLHDIADHKFHEGDHEIGHQTARAWLADLKAPVSTIDTVGNIVECVSYSAGKPMTSLEGKCVQDADRLEALGAIGIARCFAYGGSKGRPLYDPESSDGAHSIQHFYDKLLLLKDTLHTQTAAQLAKDRHEHMERFLDQFYREWSLKDLANLT